MVSETYSRFKIINDNLTMVQSNDEENCIFCSFCKKEFFMLITRGKEQFLECKCGNKISKDNLNQPIIKKPKTEKYQRLLSSFIHLKDNFLNSVREERRGTSEERVGIYVDIQNVYYSAKTEFGRRIDYKKLLCNILRGRVMETAKAYVITNSKGDGSNHNFIHLLNNLGYIVRDKELKIRLDGSQKGNADVEIALDMFSDSDNIDTAVLVSGDGDFVPLVKTLREKHIEVEVYSFSKTTSQELILNATRHCYIDESYLFEEKSDAG